MKSFRWRCLFLLPLLLIACTRSEPAKPIDMPVFNKDTRTMLNMCRKFISDSDAARVNKVASNASLLRMFQCEGYSDVCSSYASCVSAVISASEDGTITSAEKISLHGKLQDLEAEVQKARYGK